MISISPFKFQLLRAHAPKKGKDIKIPMNL